MGHREFLSVTKAMLPATNVGVGTRVSVRCLSGFVQVGQCLRMLFIWPYNAQIVEVNARPAWSRVLVL